ncbi:glycosyltransferase family 39 protein [Nitrospinae bacterium AH_259_B05_G02_I21]|nr:glycosyltransferase family 39 protein [Nitrospinae bacterium AH_259_B05_G02_I21]
MSGGQVKIMGKVRRGHHLVPVLGIAVGWIGINLLWWSWNTAPPAWDQTDYLLASLGFLDAFRDGGLPELLRTVLRSTSGFGRPPLLSLLPLPLYGLVGTGPKAAHLALLVFIPLMVFALYEMGRRLGGERAGLAACLVAATMPHLSGLSRQFFVEFPLAAVVTGTVYLLLRLLEEERVWLYVGLAASVAVGMMLKVTYILFVGPAWLIVALGSLRRGRVQGFLGLATAATVGLALASLWYLPNWHHVFWDIRESGYGIEAAPYEYGGQGLLLWRLVYGGLSVYYTAILVLLALRRRRSLASLWREESRDGVLLLISWVAVPLLIFLSAVGRDPRYLLPSIPATALGLGLLFEASREGGRLRLAPFAYPLVAMVLISFVPLSAFPASQRGSAARLYQLMGSSFQNPPLERGDWKTDTIVELIWGMERKGPHPVQTTVLANHPKFHVNLFNYAARLQGKPIVFAVCEDTTKPFSVEECLQRVVLGAEFLLDKTGLRKVAGPDRYSTLFDGWIATRCLPFQLVPVDLSLPDGSSVRLLQKDPDLQLGPSPCLGPDTP